MNRLLPLFCLCIVLPLILLFAKSQFTGTKARASTQKRITTKPPDTFSQLRKKAVAAKIVAAQKGFSTHIAFLLDMHLPSGQKRFFIYDLQKNSLLASGLVAHGSCRQRFLETAQFSNVPGCGCSAEGRYKIGGVYEGRFGKAFKLIGLDTTNSNAYQRNVVLHSYNYVPDEECYPYPICNSLGCPMVSVKFLNTAAGFVEKEKKPVLLWIYN